jgi:hypothetical protein
MVLRRLAVLAAIAAALLVFPRPAHALVTLEGFYGIARPPSVDFSDAVTGARNDSHLFKDSLQIAGGDVILHLGWLELGAIVDTTFRSGSASQTAIGGLLGLGFDLGGLRLEALGEAGGHRLGNFTENPSIVTASSTSEWLAYVGLRPGVAVRIGGTPGLILGVWGFARWDVTDRNVPVSVSGATGTALGNVKLGGTTIGATARLGIDF